MKDFRNIYKIIKNQALKDSEKTLIMVNNEKLSYGQFITEVDALADALHTRGVGPQNKIVMIIPNSLKWYIIFWGIVKTGAQPVPLDPQIGQWELEALLPLMGIEICFIASTYRDKDIKATILGCQKKIPALKTIIAIDGEDDGMIRLSTFLETKKENLKEPFSAHENLMLACTSGTTGNPKILVVPYRGFYQAQKDMADYLEFSSNDVMLVGMPLYHQGGFGMGLQVILKGGTVIYQPSFNPVDFIRLVKEEKVSLIQLTPTLAKLLLTSPQFTQENLKHVRMSYFAGERLPVEIAREFYEKMEIRVINIIGSSETATMVIWDSQYDREVNVNDFRALPFTKYKVLDDNREEVKEGELGTLYVHTDALIREYFQNERETALRIHEIENLLWFDTGDLGIRLPKGRVRFAGRSKRIIKRGANLIYPEELESFLLTHPDIQAVAVMGKPNLLFGESIKAILQPKKGVVLTRGDIARFCKGKLASYKIPDEVTLTHTIPYDIGKIQYKYLRKDTSKDE